MKGTYGEMKYKIGMFNSLNWTLIDKQKFNSSSKFVDTNGSTQLGREKDISISGHVI